jgi:hypothetical protein
MYVSQRTLKILEHLPHLAASLGLSRFALDIEKPHPSYEIILDGTQQGLLLLGTSL